MDFRPGTDRCSPLHIPQAHASKHFPGGEEVRIPALAPSHPYCLGTYEEPSAEGRSGTYRWIRERFWGKRGDGQYWCWVLAQRWSADLGMGLEILNRMVGEFLNFQMHLKEELPHPRSTLVQLPTDPRPGGTWLSRTQTLRRVTIWSQSKGLPRQAGAHEGGD